MDTLASYGQLVGAPSYDDSILFERNEDHGDPGSAAGGDRRPVMKISVTDPVKKVGPACGMLTCCISHTLRLLNTLKKNGLLFTNPTHKSHMVSLKQTSTRRSL